VPIRYPNAIYDETEQRWISDAEVAEVGFTAFTNRRKSEHVTARLVVRRVRRLNPKHVPIEQTEAFAVYRYQRCSPTQVFAEAYSRPAEMIFDVGVSQ